MFKQQTHGSPGIRKKMPNKIIAGFTALVVSTFISASAFAGATPSHWNHNPHHNKHGHGHNQPGHGYGGGGGNSVATNINLTLNNSNNNIIQVIVNVFN